MANKATTEETVNKAPDTLDPEELVPFYAFKDNRDYKRDIYVAVNGENCRIKRGEQVKIKRKFAEVLQNQMAQDLRTAELVDSESKKFRAAENQL